MGDKKSLVGKITEAVDEVVELFRTTFLSREEMKGSQAITDDREAAEALNLIGEWQAQAMREDAALAEQVLALKKARISNEAEAKEKIQRELTRLRDYGISVGLDQGEGDPKTRHLTTGDVDFHDSPVRVVVKEEEVVVAALLKLPADDSPREFVILPRPAPTPPPEFNRQLLLEQPDKIDQINKAVGGKRVKFVKNVFFSVFPTALSTLKKMKITVLAKRDVPVKL